VSAKTEEQEETYEQRAACMKAAQPVLSAVRAVAWLARDNRRHFRDVARRLAAHNRMWQAVHDDVVDHVASGWDG
jgi:hypothetical protein